MKIKAQVIINMGLYQDIRPEVTIDTDNPEETKKLILFLHKHFYKLLDQGSATNTKLTYQAKKINADSEFRPEEFVDEQ